jgi:NADPH:quinone reductase-like Zn-dependent oxidoreductase
MQAVVLEKRGKDGIRVGDFPDPERPRGNAVMRVRAAALNHVDLYMRDNGKGITHELPMVLGLDAAGEIAEADPDSGLKPGMRVMAYPCDFCGECDFCLAGEQPFCRKIKILGEQRHGTYAQYLSMKAHCFVPIPDALDFRTAAALSTAHLTAWRQVFGKTPITPGETVLVVGVGGGVAFATLQLAKLAGARVIVTSSSDEKLATAKQHGADEIINYKRESVPKRVMELTGGRGVEIAYDNVGEATWGDTLRSLGKGGRVVVVGATTGGFPPADLQRLFVRQITVYGSTTGNMREYNDLLRLASQGRLKPLIDSVYPMSRYAEALTRLEKAEQLGKIAVDIP